MKTGVWPQCPRCLWPWHFDCCDPPAVWLQDLPPHHPYFLRDCVPLTSPTHHVPADLQELPVSMVPLPRPAWSPASSFRSLETTDPPHLFPSLSLSHTSTNFRRLSMFTDFFFSSTPLSAVMQLLGRWGFRARVTARRPQRRQPNGIPWPLHGSHVTRSFVGRNDPVTGCSALVTLFFFASRNFPILQESHAIWPHWRVLAAGRNLEKDERNNFSLYADATECG